MKSAGICLPQQAGTPPPRFRAGEVVVVEFHGFERFQGACGVLEGFGGNPLSSHICTRARRLRPDQTRFRDNRKPRSVLSRPPPGNGAKSWVPGVPDSSIRVRKPAVRMVHNIMHENDRRLRQEDPSPAALRITLRNTAHGDVQGR